MLIRGRPYGGCSIFFHKSFSHAISRLNSCSTRFCALLLELLNSFNQQTVSILIVNVYLPTDYSSVESVLTFQETIAELEGFLLTQKFDHVIIAGDFNVDFTKASPNCTALESFMQFFDLVRGDTCSDITFTYRHDDLQSFSWVDHVICSSTILNNISNVMSIDSVDNFSDHLPVLFTLNTSTLSSYSRPFSVGQTNSYDFECTKFNWNIISEDDINNFCLLLQDNLPSLSSSVLSCTDPQCSSHKVTIDYFCNQLLVMIDQAAHTCFPKIVSRKDRRVPGWNVKANSLRKKAIFWDKIWKKCGCPSSGVLSTIKKNTKSRYKYEVRRLKRQADHIKCEKLAEAWCNSDSKDFWSLVRQSRGNSKFSGCHVIDGLTADDDISNMFSSKISSLLNSDLDQSTRNSFLQDLTDSISNSDLLNVEISSTVVLNALDQLKKGKSDGSSLLSDIFIFAKDILSNSLSQLFTAVVRHMAMFLSF